MATTSPRDAAWERLRAWMGVLTDLEGAAELLEWDRETDMPSGGASSRAAQLATLATLHHRELLRPEVDDALAALEGDDDPVRAASVRLARRERARATRVPEDLVRALAEASSRCVSVWTEARPRNDLPAYLHALEPLLDLKRQHANALAGGGEPYDALIDLFEPGARAADLERLFGELERRVAPLVQELAGRGSPGLPPRSWPPGAQMAVTRRIALAVGFDLSTGTVGLTAHPVTMSPGAGDVRISTRLDESDPYSNIMSTLHEAGHALYEQGLPPALARTMPHEVPSLGAHESQSRFWENHVGRTSAFWEWAAPVMDEHMPDAMRGISADTLRGALNRVERSLIRTEADEVTYDLHIALRFRLELGLVRGDLTVHDLPGAWDEGMEDLLGVRPPEPSVGVMQDIHWAAGMVGYFPTYTLGNLYAAQIAEALEREVGPIEDVISDEGFAPLLAFLRDRVHRHAGIAPTTELMERATGAPLSVDPFVRHLERIYR